MLLNLRERSKRAMSKTVDTPPPPLRQNVPVLCSVHVYMQFKNDNLFLRRLKGILEAILSSAHNVRCKANQQTVKSARQSQFPFFHLRCHLYMYIYFLFLIYYKGTKYFIHKTCNYQCLHFIELNCHMRIKASLF